MIFASSSLSVSKLPVGTPEVVEDGQSGYLVPPGDPNTLADAIHKSLVSEDLRKSMAASGKSHVLNKFSFDLQSEMYQSLLNSLSAKAEELHAQTI